MFFNSIDFAIFLPTVFILYWFIFNNNLKLQNLLIVVASYVFYGWWDWRFLSLIIFSTLVDYLVGLKLKDEKNKTKRKIEIMNLNDSLYFYDSHHLNQIGVELFNEKLINILKEDNYLPIKNK